jgi:hypothetical protein
VTRILLPGGKWYLTHLLKMRTRRASRMTTSVLDKDADIQMTTRGILHTFLVALARDVFGTDICLTHRIQYVHTYILAKIWHNLQIFPASKEYFRQIVMVITWYIWHGAVFRVPISTLQRRKDHGGLELIDVAAKCRVLLITRLWAQGKVEGSLTAEWLQFWGLPTTRSNPPTLRVVPQKLEYLRIYALEGRT